MFYLGQYGHKFCKNEVYKYKKVYKIKEDKKDRRGEDHGFVLYDASYFCYCNNWK